jgi:hypothetical protein
MGLFSSIVKTVLTGELRPMDNYHRNLNFITACCELSEKYDYDIILINGSKPPMRIGCVKYVSNLNFVELEVCKELNYRAIIIGNYYLTPSPTTQAFQNGHSTFKVINSLFITDISPNRIDRFGEKLSSPFDFLNYIEMSRKYLEKEQTETKINLTSIINFMNAEGIPWVKKIPKFYDSSKSL